MRADSTEALHSYERRARSGNASCARQPLGHRKSRVTWQRTPYSIGALQDRSVQPGQAIATTLSPEIQERLAHENPAVTDYQKALATNHNAIGVRLLAAGRPAEALASREQARAIEKALVNDNPSVTDSEIPGRHVLEYRAAQSQTGRPARRRVVREGRGGVPAAWRKKTLRSSTFSGIWRRFTTISAACALAPASWPGHSTRSSGLPILEKLAAEHPESADFASDLGGTLHNIGAIDVQQRQFEKARARFLDAMTWQRKALAVNPANPTYRQFLSNHLTGLITAAEGLGRADQADHARRELAEFTAKDP